MSRVSEKISALVLTMALFTASQATAHPTWTDEDQTLQTEAYQCIKATARERSLVDSGNLKESAFRKRCAAATSNSTWCSQIVQPNPLGRAGFSCAYGDHQKWLLIHPDERTWTFAFQAINFVRELESKGIKVSLIYNWWRPEPYNKNIDGAAGRHPFGTSVDVSMASIPEMEKAHKELCKWRKAGKIRAVGYYGSTGLHFGIGDKTGNTWGKSCP